MGEFGQLHFDQHSVTHVPLLSFIYLHHLLPTASLPGNLIVGRGALGTGHPRPRPRDTLSTRLGAYATPRLRRSSMSPPVAPQTLLKTATPLVSQADAASVRHLGSRHSNITSRSAPRLLRLPGWVLVRNHISAGYRVYCV